MDVASLSGLSHVTFLPPLLNQVGEKATNVMQFSDLVSQGIASVNEQLSESQVDLQTLATGDVQSLHQIMIRMEESRLSFQLMVQVRNRLLESYQEVMKMQI